MNYCWLTSLWPFTDFLWNFVVFSRKQCGNFNYFQLLTWAVRGELQHSVISFYILLQSFGTFSQFPNNETSFSAQSSLTLCHSDVIAAAAQGEGSRFEDSATRWGGEINQTLFRCLLFNRTRVVVVSLFQLWCQFSPFICFWEIFVCLKRTECDGGTVARCSPLCCVQHSCWTSFTLRPRLSKLFPGRMFS